MKQRIQILSAEKRQAKATLLLPIGNFVQGDISRKSAKSQIEMETAAGEVSLQVDDAPVFETFDQLNPTDGDYIYPVFRALSATLIPGYWLDYSTPGVLEASVPMLMGQTVYKNHNFYDVEQWLGAVNDSVWDAAGAESGGVPGINVELKIDWRMNPRIARGLLMKPPAIHSTSVTVLFEYDFSHPDLAEQRRFWDLLGEEVEGQIVRLIVTKIIGYWEISLVFQGADGLAKRQPDPECGDECDESEFSAVGADRIKEKNSVKLTKEQKLKLGLEAQEAEDVPDEILIPAIERISTLAAAGQALTDQARAECLRVARLAEVGAEGELPAPITTLINRASAEELQGLTAMYTERAAAKFPHTCSHCGTKSQGSRSSVETPLQDAPVAKPVKIGNALH